MLLNPSGFFSSVRASLFGGKLSQSQVDGLNALLANTACWPVSWRAYALATAFHETAFTMQPIAEYGKGKGRAYGVPGRNRGQVPYGRGYVQLTWDDNYDKADARLGLNGALRNNYELALDPTVAGKILRTGMAEGWFTGRSLKTYLTKELGTTAQFTEARRIINGTDRAATIAAYAIKFQNGLLA